MLRSIKGTMRSIIGQRLQRKLVLVETLAIGVEVSISGKLVSKLCQRKLKQYTTKVKVSAR